MITSPKAGKKYRLIFFRHSIDRVWRFILIFDVALWGAWWFAPGTYAFAPPYDRGLKTAAWVCLGLFIFLVSIRKGAYVQARPEHIKVKFPLYTIKIPYENVHTLMSQELGSIHDRKALKWSAYRFFKPYFGRTMLALLLKEYPRSEKIIKIFLPGYMFLPKDIGFLLYVKDWMGLSTEFDSHAAIQRTDNINLATVQDDSMYNLFGDS